MYVPGTKLSSEDGSYMGQLPDLCHIMSSKKTVDVANFVNKKK